MAIYRTIGSTVFWSLIIPIFLKQNNCQIMENSIGTFFHHLKNKFILPRIPNLNCPCSIVQISKTIHAMSTERRINVINIKSTISRSVWTRLFNLLYLILNSETLKKDCYYFINSYELIQGFSYL